MTDLSQSNSLPRAFCPECEKDVALRRNGAFREHYDPHPQVCPGSGLTAAQVTKRQNETFDALRRASK